MDDNIGSRVREAQLMLGNCAAILSERKIRLLTVGVARIAWALMSSEQQRTVMTAEASADDPGIGQNISRLRKESLDRLGLNDLRTVPGWGERSRRDVAVEILVASTCYSAEQLRTLDRQHLWLSVVGDIGQAVSDVIRDVAGSTSITQQMQYSIAEKVRIPAVVDLARGIYSDRAFNRLPLLADALNKAGYENEDVLVHCRSEAPHVRGCWVVDLVLGKQ